MAFRLDHKAESVIDLEWIRRTEHELGIAGHETDCSTCLGIISTLQPSRNSRGTVQFWWGPDGRKFLREDEAVAHYLRQRA